MRRSTQLTLTDIFCGAGGSSQGAQNAGVQIRTALNHWKLAIETHNTNFPTVDHDCTDVSACNPRRYPSTDILIASPECTAHTLAKGAKRKAQGQADLWGNTGLDPSEERSRATMWDVPRFAETHDYAIIIVENVVDVALYWRLWEPWLHAMHVLGYEHEAVCLNSMFCHPTPQSRDRLYVVFWKSGNRRPNLDFTPPAWCLPCGRNVSAVQSWKNLTRRIGKYGARNQYVYRCPLCATAVTPYYYCAANAIDWSLLGERIGDRARPLKEKTLERIRYGLRKFGRTPLTLRYDGAKARPLTDEMPTLTTWDMWAIMHPFVMGTERGGEPGRVYETTAPFPTQTAQQDKAIVVPPFLMGMHGDYPQAIDPTGVIPTQVATASTTAFVTPPMLLGQQSAAVTKPITDAVPVVSTAGGISLITPPFITELHNNSTVSGVDEALATVTAGGGHHGLVNPPPFLFDFYGERHGTHPMIDPASTVAGRDNHALIVPAGGTWADTATSAQHEPYPTQTTHESNGVAFMPHMLVPYYGASPVHDVTEPARAVTTHDREALVSVEDILEDCRFRMLQPREIQAAMAFPASYMVLGNSREKIKQLGNAVTPPTMSWLIERCVESLS